jgi:hypothetical protein
VTTQSASSECDLPLHARQLERRGLRRPAASAGGEAPARATVRAATSEANCEVVGRSQRVDRIQVGLKAEERRGPAATYETSALCGTT